MQHDIEINKLSDVPLYTQLHNSLKFAILEGVYKEDDRLPTEETICQFYNISRPVVRKAYQSLIDEGLVIRKQGSGTYVKQHLMISNIFFRADFSKALSEHGIDASSRIMTLDLVHKNDVEALSHEIYSSYYLIKRLRYGNKIPLMLEEFYFPTELFPDIKDEISHSLSFTKLLLQKYKIGNTDGNVKISAISMDDSLSLAFGLPVGSAVFKFITYNRYSDGTLCFFKHSYFPGKRHRIDLEVTDL